MNAAWIITTGALVAVTCSLLGCFLILRRMAMFGDAISHAVLPGILIAFLVSGGERAAFPMLVGAAAIGILCTILIEFLDKRVRLQTDASIGITYTWLFALGVILTTLFAGQVHLDTDCVLYGEIQNVPLDKWIVDGNLSLGPRSVWIVGTTLLLVAAMITIGFKGLFITTFNADYAKVIGISVVFWHYMLMGAVSLTTVVSFESVGAILVVGFLVIPPATAYLLTHSLPRMLLLSSIIGIFSSVGGYYLAEILDSSATGGMVVTAAIFFILAFIYTRLFKRKISNQSTDEEETSAYSSPQSQSLV